MKLKDIPLETLIRKVGYELVTVVELLETFSSDPDNLGYIENCTSTAKNDKF